MYGVGWAWIGVVGVHRIVYRSLGLRWCIGVGWVPGLLVVLVIGCSGSGVVHGLFGLTSHFSSYASLGSGGGVVLCSCRWVSIPGGNGFGIVRLDGRDWVRE